MADTAKYNKLDSHLHQLLKTSVNLDEENCKLMNKNLHKLLNQLLHQMKKNDEVFRALYKQKIFVGSYFENLRIKEPDEFDINLELLLPAYSSDVQIEMSKRPGFARVRVSAFNYEKTKGDTLVSGWVDEHGYLQRERVMQWLQSVVDRALHILRVAGHQEMSRTQSGPAITLHIPNEANNGLYCMDLVPVFAFGWDKWPRKPVRQPNENMPEHWFMVPKAPGGCKNTTLWRMSFTLQEKAILHNQQTMKPVIRLLKLLRDTQKWDSLCSYFIKTVFLWEKEQHRDPNLWHKGIGQLFMHKGRVGM